MLIYQYDIDAYISEGLDYFLQYSYSIYYLSCKVTIKKKSLVWVNIF